MSLDGSGLALLLQLPPLFLLLLMLANPSLQQGERLSACGGASYQIDPARPNNVVAGLAGAGAGAPRYQLVNMDALVKNACSPAMPAETPVKVYPARYVIVRCEECARCPQELGNLRRVLVQIATEAKLLSLIVMLGKDLVRPDSQRSPTTDSGVVRFVLSNDDDGLLTFCDPADAGDGESLKSFSKTSVLFVSISFIILIVISLAWLVFYYVQRFRYAHAKDRLQRRLFNAAKKALARIPTRPVKAGDKELSSDCPVCIDPYKPGDICRQLPCRHIFHKSCVDPWLLEHRTCPMCKSDILKAFGYHVSGRRRAQFSANVEEDGPTGEQDMDHRRDREDRLSIESTGSESANPFPAFTEVHDPFGFSPATSPQLIQMVNSNGFQVIPLAVPPGGNPHCEIIEAPIERHSTCEHPDETHPAVAEHQTGTESVVQQTRNGGGDHPQPQTSSTGLRLFRAVTGRRHASATQKLQQMNRSRSFSQSQISPLKLASGTLMSNEADGTKAIIFSSVNSNESLRPKELPSVVLDSGRTKNPTPVEKVEDVAGPAMSNSRAVTAPGGFRRKVGSSQGKSKQQECGHEQRATETRVDMSGTL